MDKILKPGDPCPCCGMPIKTDDPDRLLALNWLAYVMGKGAAHARLTELAQAEKDGRLVVLPPNAPLTLEELREMDGEPVWVVELNGYPPHWGLVYWCRKSKRNIVYVTINNGASICAEAFLTVGGKIYRRRPEEGMA